MSPSDVRIDWQVLETGDTSLSPVVDRGCEGSPLEHGLAGNPA
jgi:hypothetical protein